MRRLLSAALAGLLAVAVSTTPAAAHFVEWASLTETIGITGLAYGTRIPNDSFRARTTMNWDASRATNMKHMASAHGYRFTDDVQVTWCTVSATTRRETNLHNPYFDRDAHNACGDYLYRYHEAEIVAEDTGVIDFPKTSTTYYTNFYFMHWACNSSGSVCSWDPDGGTATYVESISELCGGACDDKWNTVPGEFATLGTKSYGYQSWPPPGAGSPAMSTAIRVEGALTPSASAADGDLEDFSIATDEPGEGHVRPDLTRGLAAYARQARALAREVASRGPARGIVTFARPIAKSDLGALVAAGALITDIEAVSSPARDGTRWTVGDAYENDTESAMRDIESEFGVAFLGYVAAEVVVPSLEVLDRIQSMDSVWLVDLSIEQVGRAHPNLVDISQNDLYWWLAGW